MERMSLWLAALKIQLCPHLEGEGGKWGVIRPKSEALMHSLGKRGHPPPPAPAGPREGEGRAPKRSFPCGRATCHSGGMWELNRQPSPSWVPPHPFMEPFPHLCCPEGTTQGPDRCAAALPAPAQPDAAGRLATGFQDGGISFLGFMMLGGICQLL